MVRTVMLVLALNASALAAQQPALVGVWNISYPGQVRMINGEAEVIMAGGTLTFEARGDSLIGNLVTDPSADLPARPALRLAASVTQADPVFQTRSTATLNRGGVESTATVVSTWILKAAGDRLEGTVERRLEGNDAPSQGPQPVKGKRAVK